MADLFPVEGYLCGTETYDYKSFTADDGKTVEGGTVYWVYLGNADLTPPKRVKVTADDWAQVGNEGYGTAVQMLCAPFAKGRRVEWTCRTLVSINGDKIAA